MPSRKSKSSAGSSGRSEAASKGAKATMQPTEMKTERAKGSGDSMSKRSSMAGEKKSGGSKSSK
jgi:hypothetical protein